MRAQLVGRAHSRLVRGEGGQQRGLATGAGAQVEPALVPALQRCPAEGDCAELAALVLHPGHGGRDRRRAGRDRRRPGGPRYGEYGPADPAGLGDELRAVDAARARRRGASAGVGRRRRSAASRLGEVAPSVPSANAAAIQSGMRRAQRQLTQRGRTVRPTAAVQAVPIGWRHLRSTALRKPLARAFPVARARSTVRRDRGVRRDPGAKQLVGAQLQQVPMHAGLHLGQRPVDAGRRGSRRACPPRAPCRSPARSPAQRRAPARGRAQR